MTEAELQNAVIEMARFCGWRVAHFRAAQNSRGDWRTPVAGDGKGFPDLVLAREDVAFVELKAENGRLTAEQKGWGDALFAAGAIYQIWRPDDWTSGRIERALKEGM